MSNKIALATIQFRADAKGANVALESLRSSADNARRTVNEMQAALDKGIKTMKDSTGVEFNVADRLRSATKEAKSFEAAIRELMKGATALEEVVRNIRLGEIEKSSRAELKGAINAANSRLRPIREKEETGKLNKEDLQKQRELKEVITEAEKQLNRLDRDTEKVIETLRNGGTVAESVLKKEQEGLEKILSLIPKGTEEYKQYAAQLKEIKTLVANIKQQEQIKATSLLGDQNLGKYTEEQIRAAIDAGKQLIQTYKTASPEAKALADNIARAEQHLKNYGIEAARAAAKEAEQIKTQEQAEKQLRITMNGRLRELPKLSAEALAETKKYWEAQKAGAAMGSAELAKYEANLKKIANQEEKRRRAQLDNVLTQPGQYGVAEVKAATQEMEKLRDSVKQGSAAWLHYNKMVEQGKAYLDGLALQKINTQMQNLNTLSAAGLAEVKKYWEAQVSGAALGSKELDEYKVKLEQVTAEEQRRTQLQAQQRVGVLSSGNLGQYTETQIRQAIEAGQQLIKTYATGSTEAQELAQKIVAAEQHLRQYGVEAERTAAKEAEAVRKAAEERAKNDALMKEQLQKQGALLSESALKQQQQYWQRLIDDPKTAASSLQEYKNMLEQATTLLEKVVVEEKQLSGSVVTVNDALRLSNRLSQEAIDERLRLAKIEKEEATDARTTLETSLELNRQRIETVERVLPLVEEELNKQKELAAVIEKAGKLRKELAIAQDERHPFARDYYKEEGDLLKLHDEEIKKQVKVEELKEKLDNTDDTRKKRHVRKELKRAEIELTEAREKSAAQAEKVRVAEEKLAQANEKVTKAEKDLSAVMGGLDYDTEKEKLDGLTTKHKDLTSFLEKEKKVRDDLANAVSSAQSREKKASIELAQAENVTQQSVEDAITVLEKAQKNTAQNTVEYNEQAEALKRLKERLGEMKGTLMSLADAEKLAGQLGTQGFSATTIQLQQAKKALVEAQQAAGRGTPRFQELQEAINKVDLELAKTGQLAENVQRVLDKPKGQSLNALKQAVDQGRAALANMNRTTSEGQKQFDQLAAKVKAADFEMKQLQGTSKGTASAFGKAWSRLKTYITLYVGAAVAIQKITASLGDLMELSDKMGEVQKTTNLNAEAVGRLSDKLKDLDVRTPLADLMAVSASAGQLGLKTEEDIMGFTEAANKMMIALPEMGKEAATEMMRVAIATGEVDKIRKEMSQGLIEGSSATAVAMEKIASTIDRLRASSASTAPEITDFVKRVGAVGAQSGISIDQVAALGSTISSLGMRVEMSATALSRMIPAIKNNAFSVAKAIGVTPETLRNLFETGRGMEAILLIFQHLKDAGKDADSIEKSLGLGGMQEVMKELNQQGARAGIVFAGLSQNVDELRKQLGVANQAYEENIAIQREFDRMNETAAAKWERLKNQFEEFFIGDASQRFMGGLIDTLRGFVDVLTGNVGPALQTVTVLIHTFLAYWGALKLGLGEAIFVKAWEGLKNLGTTLSGLTTTTQRTIVYTKLLAKANEELAVATTAVAQAEARQKIAAIEARMAQENLNKAMVANIWMAVAVAVGALVLQVVRWIDAANEAGKEAAKFESELMREQMQVDNLTDSIGKARAKIDETNKDVERAQKAFNEAKKSLDGTRESTDRLTKAETELIEKQEAQRKAIAEHKRMIEQFNTEYGKYLGFMLSEVSSNLELAQARELVNNKLRETITLKKREAAITRVENKYGEDRDDAYASLLGAARYASTSKDSAGKMVQDPTKAAKVMNAITKAANNDKLSREQFEKTITSFFKENKVGYRGTSLLSKALDYFDEVKNVREKTNEVLEQYKAEDKANREQSQKGLERQYKAAADTYLNLQRKYVKATGDARKQAAADMLKQMDSINEMVDNSSNYFDMTEADEKRSYNTFIKNGDARLKGMNAQREKLLKEAGNAYQSRKKVGGGETSSIKTNPWGGSHEAESIDWKNMNADQLVERRKQMNEFVKAIQTDSDVQSVLKEDAALKAAIEKGMSSDMRTVIEWYNTERLKIQDELHARHLTNTGAWQDPKQQKARQKQFTDEMRAMLEELDAYYTERNQKIQDARNNDEITEGEAWRRTIKNETEWYNRRAELQKLYANRGSEVTAEEQQAIFNIIAEKTGDTAGFIKRSVENTVKFAQDVRKKDQKGEVEYRKWMADLMLGVEKDYLKSAKSIGKQVKFIEETLAKERPYDSITKNLQDNLDKMGILAVRYKRINDELEAQGKEKKYSDAQIKAATFDEMAFYLKNAADAWSIDIDELLRRMVKEGMAVTAEEISKSDMLKQAVMGQLRKTFEEVQNAIKKEASQIKKNVDIIWNDDSQGPGGTSMKSAFEKAISQLGMQQDSVSRANSLINAGFASEDVAARLALKQIEMQMRMQKAQFDMFRVQAAQRIKALAQEAKEHERIADSMAKEGQLDEAKKERLMATNALQDAENMKKALGLTLTQETKEEEKQKTELLKLQEESQARLYKELQDWVSLMTKGLQGVFEAANFYNSSDYNNLAVARAGGSFNRTTTETVTNSSSSTTKNTSTSRHTSTGTSQTTSTKKTEQGSTAAEEGQSKSSTSKNSASNTDTHTTTSTTGTKTSTSTREKQVDYYIIENAGTKDAVATQVSMTEEEYYEKKIELDRDNAIKEAWKNLLDELNMKMSETITDQINAMFQNAAINANTEASKLNAEALKLNTEGEQQLTAALKELATTEALKVAREANDFSAAYQEGGNGRTLGTGDMGVDENGVPNALKEPEAEGPVIPKAPWQMTEEERAQAQEGMATLWNSYAEYGTAAMQNMTDATAEMPSIVTNPSYMMTEEQREVAVGNNASLQQQLTEQEITNANLKADGIIAASNRAKNAVIANEQQMGKTTTYTNNQNAKSTQAAMAKMTLATQLYGLAYQTMSNDNLNATQKFLMFAVQAAGQAAISMLTTNMAQEEADSKAKLPGIFGKAVEGLGPIAGPIAFAAMTALLGGLMGMAVSAVSKGKSEIAQATGASTSSNAKSISAGKLMTGMLTYGEGNVNEFTDPSSLTPGRSYNVDSADGKTYRAKYMGVGAKTHLTNGPEFHLVGERGREAIIDAHTTRLMQMDDTGIWQAIQTLYNGGSLCHSVMRRKGRGMAAFADGNIDEFETMADGGGLMAGGAGLSSEQMMALQASIDRQSDLLERAMTDGIHAYFDVYGRGGLIDSYDTGKKTVTSHGERY